MAPSFLNMLFLTFVFSILPTSRCSECLNICVHKAYFTVSLSSLTTSFLYHDHCSHLHCHPLPSALCPISTNCFHLQCIPSVLATGQRTAQSWRSRMLRTFTQRRLFHGHKWGHRDVGRIRRERHALYVQS